MSESTAEQVAFEALSGLAADRNYPGGDLDLVDPDLAAVVVVAALRAAGMLGRRDGMITLSDEGVIYRRGLLDGGLAIIAAALGVDDEQQPTLWGHPVHISIEWPNGTPPDDELALIRQSASNALTRTRSGRP